VGKGSGLDLHLQEGVSVTPKREAGLAVVCQETDRSRVVQLPKIGPLRLDQLSALASSQ
jgi:hypothetical protein